ncbi:MAG: OB-fold domain-containing protein [Solirubrobacterales bacterium]|nr:OB-fold domain-containing protein [Solirubrobacterales bacterium]
MASPRSPFATFQEHCARGELAFQVDDQGAPLFPPRVGPTKWQVSQGRGIVYSTTTVVPRGALPYNVSLIDLAEGFRMMSTVQSPDVEIGLAVEVRFDDQATAYFVPAEVQGS